MYLDYIKIWMLDELWTHAVNNFFTVYAQFAIVIIIIISYFHCETYRATYNKSQVEYH